MSSPSPCGRGLGGGGLGRGSSKRSPLRLCWKAIAMSFRTLDNVDVAGKRVLLRADLNVPVRDGKITDLTRLERLTPTIRELVRKGAKVIVCSHFDRPKGKRVPAMSLAPVATALGEVLGQRVRFAEDCIGVARTTVGRPYGTRRRAGAGEHPLPRRGREERPRLRRRTCEAGGPLRQRRVLRRPSRACQHRGRRAQTARLRRPPDAGGTRGPRCRARQSRSVRSPRSSAAPRSPPS